MCLAFRFWVHDRYTYKAGTNSIQKCTPAAKHKWMFNSNNFKNNRSNSPTFSTTVVPRALSWSYFTLRKLAKCVLRRVIAYSVRHLAGSCCLPLCGVYQRPSFALGPLEGAFSSAEGLEHSSVARGRRHTWSQYSRLITSQRRDNVTVAVACNHRASRKDT